MYLGRHLAFPDPHGLIQPIIQAVDGGRVVPYSHLSVGMVSRLASSSSSYTLYSHFPPSPLAGSLRTGGDLGKLAPVRGPQVCLGAPAVEEQEVHTGWAAFTHSCKGRRREINQAVSKTDILRGRGCASYTVSRKLAFRTYSSRCKESDSSHAAWCLICSWSLILDVEGCPAVTSTRIG